MHFTLEDGLYAESATLEELETETGKKINNSEYSLLNVPLQDRPYLLRLPEKSSNDFYTLTPMKSS